MFKPNEIIAQIEQPTLAVSFDVEAFDEAIVAHGVTFIHYRHMRCPVGLTEMYSERRPHEDHAGCTNGYVYTPAGEVKCLFTGNQKKRELTDLGLLDGSTVQVTLPRFYDNSGEPIEIAQFDRLYLDEESITVPHCQLFTASPTGKDKLSFPVVSVTDLIDNRGERYKEGQDFDIVNGYLVWNGTRRPLYDAINSRGAICSVRYRYRPYWYVAHLIHEVRVSQIEDVIKGERRIERMPQSAMLQREYVFETADKDPQSPADPARQVKAPGSGSIYPR